MELNCDMGEAFGIYSFGADEALMDHVGLANVACGFHGGDPVVLQRDRAAGARARRARGRAPVLSGPRGLRPAGDGDGARGARGVPDLPDRGASGFLDAEGMALSHVKPHGALYGRAARDREVAEAVADAASVFGVPVFGMAGTLHEEVYTERGLEFMAEYYADLDYDDDGGLIITRKHVAYDPAEAAARVARVMREGVAVSANGREIPMRADTVCVHSDTPTRRNWQRR